VPDYRQQEAQEVGLFKKARLRVGWTQADLASHMVEQGFPWTQPTVARVEGGKRAISLAEAYCLCDVLEINRGTTWVRISHFGHDAETVAEAHGG
jgi:transcriptional regulator with XRE-family HTH domain